MSASDLTQSDPVLGTFDTLQAWRERERARRRKGTGDRRIPETNERGEFLGVYAPPTPALTSEIANPPASDPSDRRPMSPLVVSAPNAALKVRDARLVVTQAQARGEPPRVLAEYDYSAFPYDQVILDPNGGFVTNLALKWIIDKGAAVTMLGFNGSVLGTMLPARPRTAVPLVRLRLEQMKAFLNEPRRHAIARRILEAKLKHPVPECYQTVPDLLAYEGREADGYWRELGIVRSYPKARDPVNAVLNYAYGLLESRARIVIHRLGLDPTIGFLHEAQDGKEAFVYDLQEPWRADVTKAALTAKRGIGVRDFTQLFRDGWRVNARAATKVVEAVTAALRGRAEVEMGTFARGILSTRWRLPSV